MRPWCRVGAGEAVEVDSRQHGGVRGTSDGVVWQSTAPWPCCVLLLPAPARDWVTSSSPTEPVLGKELVVNIPANVVIIFDTEQSL